jgi:hypothetical protein
MSLFLAEWNWAAPAIRTSVLLDIGSVVRNRWRSLHRRHDFRAWSGRIRTSTFGSTGDPGSTPVSLVAKGAITIIPIAFGVAENPMTLGLVASLDGSSQPFDNRAAANYVVLVAFPVHWPRAAGVAATCAGPWPQHLRGRSRHGQSVRGLTYLTRLVGPFPRASFKKYA